MDHILSCQDWSAAIPIDEIPLEIKSMIDDLNNCERDCQTGHHQSKAMLQRALAGHQIAPVDLTELNRQLNRFQKRHSALLGLLEAGRLSNQQELLQKRERLEALKSQMERQAILVAELESIVSFFESQRDTILFFSRLMDEKYRYFNKIAEINSKPGDSSANHLALARRHAAAAELWRAEEAYQACFEAEETTPSAWQELIELYIKFGMWQTAQSRLDRAVNLFPQAAWPPATAKMLQDNAQKLYSEAKRAFKQGNLPLARCRLNAYLDIFPHDPKAADLQSEILRPSSGARAAARGEDCALNQPLTKLTTAIERLCQFKEYERAIGILEGMLAHLFPDTAACRWKIGQLRCQQGDYPGALWNFEQALDGCPPGHELYQKLQTSIALIKGSPQHRHRDRNIAAKDYGDLSPKLHEQSYEPEGVENEIL